MLFSTAQPTGGENRTLKPHAHPPLWTRPRALGCPPLCVDASVPCGFAPPGPPAARVGPPSLRRDGSGSSPSSRSAPGCVGHAAVNDAADETLEDLSAAGGRCPGATSVRCGCAVMTPTAIHGAPREASADEQPRSAQYARHRLGSAPSCRNLVEPDHLPFRRLALKDRRALHRGLLGCGEPEVASDWRRSFHRPCSLWANPSARRRRLNDVTNRWSSVFAGPTRNGPISARKRTDLDVFRTVGYTRTTTVRLRRRWS